MSSSGHGRLEHDDSAMGRLGPAVQLSLDGSRLHDAISVEPVHDASGLAALDGSVAIEVRWFETVREPHAWIRIRAVSGDLRALQGAWRLRPLEGGALLVSHEVQVQPAWPVPRWAARRTVHRDVERLLRCLRWTAGASPDGPQRGWDKQACTEVGGATDDSETSPP